MKTLWKTEPAMVIAVVVAILDAVLVPEAWSKVVVAVLTLLAGTGIRSQVSPTSTT